VAFPLYRLAGSVLDYEMLLELGLAGLDERIGKFERRNGSSPFYRGCRKALQVLDSSISRLTEQAREVGLDDPAAVLEAIRQEPPQTLRQAIQLLWLYALHSGTWNYGRLDDVLGPFLVRDLEENRLTEESAVQMLEAFWRLMADYNNQYNNRVMLGGRGRRHREAADRFALLAMEATRRVRLNQPQLSLRFERGQNPQLLQKAYDVIGEGCTFPILYNDDVNVPAVGEAFAVPETVAQQYFPFGCGEYVPGSLGQGSPNGVINLTQALLVALHGGRDPGSGREIVPGLPGTAQIRDFETLWESYCRVTERHVEALARQQSLEFEVTAGEAPFLFLSLLTHDCLDRGKSFIGGGARFLGGTLETYGNTNTADSLAAIRHLVFEQQRWTLPELVQACDADFTEPGDGETAGFEPLHDALLSAPKYGNDNACADALAERVHEHICRVTAQQAGRESVNLDYYLVVIINNHANTVLGHHTPASPDGRRAGSPLANGNNPGSGSDTQGVTAFLKSIARLNPAVHAGTVQNMKFSGEWFADPEMRGKWEALMATYFAMGGTQAMVTVVNRQDLEAAMKAPQEWAHLMVRVGGFSIRFIDLPQDVQKEVLARTLN
jgi:pyruvate-formate lyase